MTTSSFDDFINSLLETDLELVEAAPNKSVASVQYPCGQCAGTGRYMGARVHQEKSHCFACRGLGYFKSSPEARKKHRANAAASRKNKLEIAIAAFAEQEPTMFSDLLDCWKLGVGGHAFIHSLANQLFTKGRLTTNQIAAWYRGKEKLAQLRAERAAEAAASAVAVDLTPIRTMFETAVANGYKKPTYRAEGLVLNRAPDGGNNPGALYVKDEAGDYLGKVVGITFHPVRNDAAKAAGTLLVDIAKDPLAAAIRYGQRTGKCACCGRELTNHTSIDLGIGPICRAKWGL